MHHHPAAPDWLGAAEIIRIRNGFGLVAADADGFTADFYARLFELAPTVRALFPDDLAPQRKKLGQVLVMLMASLDRPAALQPVLAALGDRHRAYGVVRSDFIVVGQALLATLAANLGPAFTDADRAAWTALYSRITSIMTGAARAAAA